MAHSHRVIKHPAFGLYLNSGFLSISLYPQEHLIAEIDNFGKILKKCLLPLKHQRWPCTEEVSALWLYL